MKRVGVGLCGLGRSGWFLHAPALEDLREEFEVVSVCDADPRRSAEAAKRFCVMPAEDFDSLLKQPQVELVVVAVPSCLHEELAIRALNAGKHVVVEKPFATSLDGAERMILTAQRCQRIVTCSQNLRFFPDFAKVREVIASGQLGQILTIRIAWHRFRRRWDWQAMRDCGGGNLYNEGSHLIDQALVFIGGEEPEVFVKVRRSELSIGDTENHAKIVLSTRQGPLVDLEMTDSSAYEQQRWFVMGSLGGLTGSLSHLEWKYIDPRVMCERTPTKEPTADRSFNSEPYAWKTEAYECHNDPYRTSFRAFYSDLFSVMMGRKNEPAISTQDLYRQMSILEHCKRVQLGGV
jgi:predicted dehydrogenase